MTNVPHSIISFLTEHGINLYIQAILYCVISHSQNIRIRQNNIRTLITMPFYRFRSSVFNSNQILQLFQLL